METDANNTNYNRIFVSFGENIFRSYLWFNLNGFIINSGMNDFRFRHFSVRFGFNEKDNFSLNLTPKYTFFMKTNSFNI